MSKEEMPAVIKIKTDQGNLYVPRFRPDAKEEMRKDGWILLEDMYYMAERFDVLAVSSMYRFPFMIFKDRNLTFEGDDWWMETGGAMVPPYKWEEGKWWAVAWRPTEETKA